PGTLTNAAMSLSYFGEDIDTLIAVVDRAVALNPSFARGWYISGMMRNWKGEPEIGLEHLATALRLAPRGRFWVARYNISVAHFLMHRFAEAASNAQLALQDEPEFTAAYRILAASYAHLGRLDDARAVLTRLRGIAPLAVEGISINAAAYRNPAHRDLIL